MRTGALAIPCPACEGVGHVQVLRGTERLPHYFDCDDCSSTGWEVLADVPAVEVPTPAPCSICGGDPLTSPPCITHP